MIVSYMCVDFLFWCEMTEKVEQRYCIKFCQKLGETQSETIRKIQQVFGNDAMGVTQIKEWFNRFKNGRTSAESDPRSGRPKSSRNPEMIEKASVLIKANRRLTVSEIASDLDISFGSAEAILTEDLGLRRVAAKFVPKLLTAEQKQRRVDISQDMLQSVDNDDNFLTSIITEDESWVYGYDPETKFQSSQWQSPQDPRPKKARQVRSNVKVMLTVFFDHRGVVHHEYAPQGQTVNKEYYLEVQRRLRDAIRRKRPDLWESQNWQLHHDNAPAHTSNLVQHFLAKHGTTQVSQPPYSPDMAPCDFWLFPHLKKPLKGTRFESREAIMEKTTADLLAIPKIEFKNCFHKWIRRWNHCIESQGSYFEEN